MSKVCKECGHQMDDNVQVCPNCGCPVENASASVFMDKGVLNQGKSTEAELLMAEYANSILKWGKVLSFIAPILMVSSMFATGISFANANQEGLGWLLIIMSIILFFFLSFLFRLFAKIAWGSIMLFVNLSTTLKRIELKLEENGTH